MGRPKNSEKKKAESIYFEPDLIDWLKTMAEAEERTTSYIVNRIVREKKEQEDNNGTR